MSTEDKLRSYVLENFLFTDDQSVLKNNDSFIEKGIIDSTGILEVIYFVEDEFKIKIDDSEMIPENLDSIEKITTFISNKTS